MRRRPELVVTQRKQDGADDLTSFRADIPKHGNVTGVPEFRKASVGMDRSRARPQKKCPKGPSRGADPIPFFFVLFVAFCGENRRQRRKQRTTARDLNSPFEGSPYPSCSEV
jgi:hypothetical protein